MKRVSGKEWAAGGAQRAAAKKRQRLLALIHLAKRDLGLDEGTYRELLRNTTGKESAKEMTMVELARALDRLRSSGFGARKRHQVRQGETPLERKARAIWRFLHQIGATRSQSEASLGAYCKRIAGVDRVEWLSSEQEKLVIESLKRWAMRYLPGQVQEMAMALKDAVRDGRVSIGEVKQSEIDFAVGKARKHQGYDPMRAAWVLLAEYVPQPESKEA